MMNIIRPSLMSRHYKILCVRGVRLQGWGSAYVCFVISGLRPWVRLSRNLGQNKWKTLTPPFPQKNHRWENGVFALRAASSLIWGGMVVFSSILFCPRFEASCTCYEFLSVFCCTAPRLLNTHPLRRDLLLFVVVSAFKLT